ncbi:CMRF35-like molecule 1, partial [Nematolebias whitei]|uniref:CMRF35-like molecule 1 n=1 Tax=Nematolebias whitei TaxID=451745 RepID=UPI001899617D
VLTSDERMKTLLVTFCCFSVVCTEASDILEVSSHVGEKVSIPCFGSWTANSPENISMFFCKGTCSSENSNIQTETKRSALPRGRYSMEFNGGHGVWTVTIKRLRRADAGRYLCGLRRSSNISYQEVNLNIVNAPRVPLAAPPSPKTSLKAEEVAQPEGSFPSASPVTLTLLPSGRTEIQEEANSLTDTKLVIFVSGSLACLVCAVIPLLFYRLWQRNAGQNRRAANKAEDGHHEESVVAASTQVAVSLQPLEDGPESTADDDAQYASVYEGLDPKTID